ncbi:hypothetical protein LTR36_008304 [Oleoguttula mirabilis]|uniref:Peptidase S53 domain-containing protein n=1 Tax=Oleoguttula mirabilis TaxID=1507867 RepID=A0AAV9J7T3_9PEZI|nr:hypothetical protein LTR36_008304 [Oleoguttula mirabilis]
MLHSVLLALGALAATTPTAAVGWPAEAISGHIVHESRVSHASVASRWRQNGRVEADAVIPVRIGLKQSNLEAGSDQLLAISHPNSEDYGKHLTPDEVDGLFAPSDDTVNAVRDWLISAGVDNRTIAHSDSKGWLAADMMAEHAERLFRHELHEHIDYVTPGVKFSAPLKKRSLKRGETSNPKKAPGNRPNWKPIDHQHWHMPALAYNLTADLQACGVNITPPCLRALYGIPIATINDSVNSIGLYEQGDYYSGADIDSFFASFQSRVPQGTRPILKGIDGGIAPVAASSSLNGGESDIDIDITISLVYPQSVTLYQVDDQIYSPAEVALDNTFNTFLDALDGSYCSYTAYNITGDTSGIDPTYPDNATDGYKGQLQCGVYKPTRVISASYGESEGDLPKAYVERQCNEFMKLGLQGHSIFMSSSDFGVGNFANDPEPNGCLSGNGQNQTIFNPDYPVGCPWVTSVGATQLYANQTVLDAESAMAVDLWSTGDSPVYHYFSSAGGFSNKFEAPAYQKAALSEYFGKHDPGYPTYVANANLTNIGIDGGLYNRAGRGYPDVSANGAYMLAYTGQSLGHWFGTSLASPIWASVITLVNQQRTIAGKGPVGFINPTLYENPWALKDIVNGSNPNCGSAGFHAVSGWDPVTGLGTPNYPKLLDLFLSLP